MTRREKCEAIETKFASSLHEDYQMSVLDTFDGNDSEIMTGYFLYEKLLLLPTLVGFHMNLQTKELAVALESKTIIVPAEDLFDGAINYFLDHYDWPELPE